jgi:anti-anti-sigma factor
MDAGQTRNLSTNRDEGPSRIQVIDGICTVRTETTADGEWDEAELRRIEQATQQCLAQQAHAVVLDLSSVEFLSEQAVALLLELLRLLKDRSARFALAAPSGPVRQKLTRMGVVSLFPVFDDASTARAALKATG